MSWFGNIIKKIFNNEGLYKPPVKEEVDLKAMTKKQLEAYGRSQGIELDRRQNKAKLIKQLEAA